MHETKVLSNGVLIFFFLSFLLLNLCSGSAKEICEKTWGGSSKGGGMS